MISYTHRRNLPQPVACQRVFLYDRSILRPKQCAYYHSGRPVIKIGHIIGDIILVYYLLID